MTATSAGYVILWAQLVDAVFNLWVGNECDKVTVIGKYGRRKGWHFIGTAMVVVAMAFNYTAPFKVIFFIRLLIKNSTS
jgi:Na+/melibiose symporter-like transporter